jgi:hypothetical protein
MRAFASTVRPEPVKGYSFPFAGEAKAKGFDKLSPNECGRGPSDFLSARLVPIS